MSNVLRKVSIGNVLLTDGACSNPYLYRGALRSSTTRLEVLQALRRGQTPEDVTVWEAPWNGGARTITADDIDWGTSGVEV